MINFPRTSLRDLKIKLFYGTGVRLIGKSCQMPGVTGERRIRETQKQRCQFLRSVVLCLLFFAVASTQIVSVHAHDGAKGVVKERMLLMKLMGRSMKSLSAIAKGKVAFDEEKINVLVEMIKSESGEKFLNLFPAGSAGAPSEASPAIWHEWERFVSLNGVLKKKAEKVTASLSSDDPEGNFNLAFRELGGSCSACHKAFRSKNQ
jgi:cytochrome c556